MYLLDSNICIDLMRGKYPYMVEMMRSTSPDMFKIPAIVLGELKFGDERSERRFENQFITENFLRPFEFLPFDEASARVYGRIRARLVREGRIIGPNDLLIAAMAIAHQAILITNNTREFERIDELSVESWHELSLVELR